MTKLTVDAETIGEAVGEIAVGFGFVCLNAWLLSIAMSWFFPMLILSFWQWVLVIMTYKSITYKGSK
jgi:hypothetical protein